MNKTLIIIMSLELLTDKFQGEGIVTQYEKIDKWLKGMGY